MAWAKGNKYGGRPKGAKNKLTQSAKEAFEFAFHRKGGVDGLVNWAMENETEFYKLYAKLIPVQVNANVAVDLGDRLERAKARAGT